MSGRRITIVNFTRMGDILQSGPFMRALKDAYRNAHLTLVVFERFRDAAEHLPMVDRVIGLDVDQLTLELDRQGNFARAYAMISDTILKADIGGADEVYNLSHTPLAATLCTLLGGDNVHGMRRTVAGRIAVEGDWFAYLLSVLQDRQYNSFNLVEIYRRMAPSPARNCRLEFVVSARDRAEAAEILRSSGMAGGKPYIVLQPGASSDSRRWPAAAFAGLADLLAEQGYRSVVVGASGEETLAREIRMCADSKPVSLVGKTAVGSLAAILEGAHKVCSNDTGTIHLAAAVGTPTVGIYLGPAAAKDTAPYGAGHLVLEADLDCAPCAYQHHCTTHRCHAKLTARDVCALALAAPDAVAGIASRLQGVRVMRTNLGAQVELRLEPLNRPRFHTDERVFRFYRGFWDALLNGHPAEPQVAVLLSTSDVEPLKAIFRAAMAQPLQTNWHDDLHRFSAANSALSAFTRYLEVKISTLRTDRREDYLRDVHHILDQFLRGLKLIEAVTSSKQDYAACHAAAC